MRRRQNTRRASLPATTTYMATAGHYMIRSRDKDRSTGQSTSQSSTRTASHPDSTTATETYPTFSTSSQTRHTRACTEPTTSPRLARPRLQELSLVLRRWYMGSRSTKRGGTARKSLKSIQSLTTATAPRRHRPRQSAAKTRTTAALDT
ncbi:hypothetical protein GGF43_005007, partial [Coemansia sp. RSA 2618]